ncbi:MAG: hypothetical protein C0467_23910 [Planctomycetaceae bacterium]|nr:hypothetical protein [Planctomycetaceae bacterium]
MEQSIFLDFHLPNAATWLYFSLILSLTLFFQFSRPFCVRNLDLLTLFLLSPGFLLLQEAHHQISVGRTERGERELIFGYSWLLVASAYWFFRTVFDMGLVRRPSVSPNLTVAGLGFLGIALFVGQTSVALRRTADPAETVQVGKRPAPIEQVQGQATAVVQQAPAETIQRASPDDVRFWVERTLCMACHAAIVVGLLMIGLKHFQDLASGIGMGTLYLLVPYTAFDIGRQLHHVWPTAFLVWAVFSYRRPVVAGWLLGLATGTALFPALLFPLWFGFYARRGAGRFARAFLAAVTVSVGITALVMGWGGEAGFGIATTLSLPDWQPWRMPNTESIWTGAHWAYRLPLFVLFVAFLAGVAVWPRPKNLSHLISLSAAILIGVQFWHADRGGVYVLWYLPFLVMMVFRPNLSSAEPPGLTPANGIMSRLAGAAWKRVRPPRQEPPKQLAV